MKSITHRALHFEKLLKFQLPMKIDSLDTFYGLTSDHVSTSHSKQLEIFAQKGVNWFN